MAALNLIDMNFRLNTKNYMYTCYLFTFRVSNIPNSIFVYEISTAI